MIRRPVTRESQEQMETMTAVEVVRLTEWLTSHGLTYEDAYQCLVYIAYGEDSDNSN